MKIYFTGAISGGRENAEIYPQIAKHLQKYGTILTEHVADQNLTALGETDLTDREIHDRDINWIMESDVVVAEVSTPSLGVGYEIAKAEKIVKGILCLYRNQDGKKLSAMIAGSSKVTVAKYNNLEEIIQHIDNFFNSLKLK